MGKRELERVRRIALKLPGVSERPSDGAPCFFVRNKRPLFRYHDNHRGDDRVSVWLRAPPGMQDILVDPEGGRFFRPSTSASGTFRNWVGVFLDMSGEHEANWEELAVLMEDSYRAVAPKKLIAEIDNS